MKHKWNKVYTRNLAKTIFTIIFGITVFIIPKVLKSQQKEHEAYKYKHMLNNEEESRKDQIGKSFIATDPPAQFVRNIAEFEPMSGVLVRYPFGIPLELIKSFAEKDTVFTIVANSTEETTVRNQYQSIGIDLNLCKFLHINTDSYWTRDFGPLFIVNGNNEVGIVNFIYNRPRPNDDDFPMALADFMNINWYGMNVVQTGGNYMTDGYGTSASTKIVYTESNYEGITTDSVNRRMFNYLGINNYHVLDDPNNTYIDHIDCWGKFLDVDKILIRSVQESHPQYNEIEEMAKYWMKQKSSWGNYYKVYRVYTPDDQPYTNSLILNGRVFVPQMDSDWDNEALEVYREAMPGFEVLGFTGDWLSTDALHCRTHEIADKHMLQIQHKPILGYQEFSNTYSISADIKDLSKKGLYKDSLMLVYRVNESDWNVILLDQKGKSEFAVEITDVSEGSKIEYYIHSADSSGRSEDHPYMGKLDPHVFYVAGNEPILSLSHEEIAFESAENTEFVIQNNFSESITILDIENDLNYANANPTKTLNFPLNLASDSSIVFNICPFVVTKESKGYNTDTLKIFTVDSLYQLVINCNESLVQGIDLVENVNIAVYPNPFKDKIKIEATNLNGAKFKFAYVVNISGQIIDYLDPIMENSNHVELEWDATNRGVLNGNYFISIIFDLGVKTVKVFKN